MTDWIARQLKTALKRPSGTTVLLDPSCLVDDDAAATISKVCRMIRVEDWAGLRRAWDLDIRRQSDERHTLACVSSADFVAATDLPWDIEHEAAEVLRLRQPMADVSPEYDETSTVEPDAEQTVAELLAAQPSTPTDLEGWIAVASWWGQVRAAIAAVPTPPSNAATAWRVWEELDNKFRPWLRSHYGSSLLSAAPFAALHRVAPSLARRVEVGAAVLLVVIDGLGFAQWHPLRQAAGLTVLESIGSLAMIPTLTSVSRQAIFAGALPREFATHLRTTSAEERHWRHFWRQRGLADKDISYAKTLGGDSGAVPELRGRVAAVVVNAIDEILHSAEVLGDRQVAAGVDLWARAGFLANLVSSAGEAGYETWITSDHGNLPTQAGAVPREGQTVEQAGIRVRVYPNAMLREQAVAHGESWDPPGLPTESAGYYPLFATGRSGYHTGASRVSHGGISLDEVIVPVARVST